MTEPGELQKRLAEYLRWEPTAIVAVQLIELVRALLMVALLEASLRALSSSLWHGRQQFCALTTSLYARSLWITTHPKPLFNNADEPARAAGADQRHVRGRGL